MSAPRTRLDEGVTDFERDMLRSWNNEAPSTDARQKVIALGVAGTLAGAASTATATGGTTGAAIAGGLAPKATVVAVSAIAKWLAAGAVVVSGTVIAMPYLRGTVAVPPPANGSQVVLATAPPLNAPPADVQGLQGRAAPADEVALPTSSMEQEVPVVPVPPADRASPTRSAVRARPAASVAPPAPVEAPVAEEKHATRELGEQVASVDRAERALAAGDSAEALRLIDGYENRFPAGMLQQEATLVRIDALLKQGQRDKAAAMAERFLAAHPTSPHAAKLRRQLESGSNR